MGRWTEYEATDFEEFYWSEVAPEMEAADLNPGEPPTRDWLVENGFSGFYQAVRKHTKYTFLDFCDEIVGITRGHDHPYRLSIEDPQTREYAYRYAERQLMGRKGRGKDSAGNVLYSADRVAYALQEAHGSDNLLELGNNETPEALSYEKLLAAFDILDEEHADSSMMTIHSHVKNLYNYLLRRRTPVDYNPLIGIRDEFEWERGTGDPPAMSPDQVQALAQVAEDTHELTLVVLHCVAGLRRNEVARIHREMVVFNPDEIDTPVIEFKDRKNGPGTVNLVYGADVIQERIKELEEDHGDDWNGYLFPSPNRNREHLDAKTTSMHFDDLVERAARDTDVEMVLEDGDSPTPQTARRYWYNQYSMGIGALMEAVKDIAGEQGSSDAGVVLSNYLSKERRLKILRDHMVDTLGQAFEGTTVSSSYENTSETGIETSLEELNSADTAQRQSDDERANPVDRFISENKPEESERENEGWLSDTSFSQSNGGTKAAFAAVFVGVFSQLLLFL